MAGCRAKTRDHARMSGRRWEGRGEGGAGSGQSANQAPAGFQPANRARICPGAISRDYPHFQVTGDSGTVLRRRGRVGVGMPGQLGRYSTTAAGMQLHRAGPISDYV